MTKKNIVVIFLAIFLAGIQFFSSALYAKEEYRHVLVLGADKPFSNGDSSLGPIVAYYYFMEDFANPDYYGEFAFKTTDCYFKFGLKNDKYFAGVQPNFSYIWYGGYAAYDKGDNDDSRLYWGNNVGAIFFFQYNWTKAFSSTLAYRPDYRFYSKGTCDTDIDLPNDHWQHMGSLELNVNKFISKNMSRVKNGFKAKIRYEYAHRVGYGTFEDTIAVQDSDINNSHKVLVDVGVYYSFLNNYNLLLDINGGIGNNLDRNNAEKIGYYCADHAVVPGYNAAEFYHDRYLVARLQLGMPLPFWNSRIKPGINVLYMPEDNGVVGIQDYDRQVYRSISVEFSSMLGGVLPCYVDYAYGIDAERKGEKGNHEVMVLFVAAFGKN